MTTRSSFLSQTALYKSRYRWPVGETAKLGQFVTQFLNTYHLETGVRCSHFGFDQRRYTRLCFDTLFLYKTLFYRAVVISRYSGLLQPLYVCVCACETLSMALVLGAKGYGHARDNLKRRGVKIKKCCRGIVSHAHIFFTKIDS